MVGLSRATLPVPGYTTRLPAVWSPYYTSGVLRTAASGEALGSRAQKALGQEAPHRKLIILESRAPDPQDYGEVTV